MKAYASVHQEVEMSPKDVGRTLINFLQERHAFSPVGGIFSTFGTFGNSIGWTPEWEKLNPDDAAIARVAKHMIEVESLKVHYA